MAKTMMFNPYTGTPRHPSDIASDPAGLLIIDDGEPLRAAAKAKPEAQQPMPEPDVAEAVFDYYQHFRDPQDIAEACFGKDLAIFRLAERACAEAWGVKLGASGEKQG